MKNLIQYSIISFLLLGLWNCQPILKAPVATVMSATLPNPEIESTKNENESPLADFKLRVKDLEGNIINMADYKDKVIFLNFWATWCMPCVAELPSINKMYLSLKNKDIAFLLISNEQPEKVKHYHERKKYDVPFHIIDKDGFIPQQYYSRSIPTTFIINKKGRIVKSTVGPEDWDDEKFIETINALIEN